ncbi:MAG: hypothetical protein ONB44_05575 [candidate division KSB1 bacterium]|nr:hypothetical protein [candidate division KSB1 bacterium]MDZ7301595.1 hypothetical protein [candidate division KSB1 bacterium]MDZ7310989.1 hypothetical protein [candidate division KSB1 bacterium]
MQHVFNLGLGLVFVVAPTAVDQFRQQLTKIGERSWVMGEAV